MSNDCLVASGSQERFTFAQIPLVMRHDPDLKLTDIAVTMFVLPWLEGKKQGWVSLKTIAKGAKVGVSTVKDSLARLKVAGWFAAVPSSGNKTRREFVALWKTDEGFAMLRDRLERCGVSLDVSRGPALVYVVTRIAGPAQNVPVESRPAGPNEEGCKRSFSLKPLEVGARTDGLDLPFIVQRAACSPSCETTLTGGGAGEDGPAEDADVGRLRRAIPHLRDRDLHDNRSLLRGVIRSNARIASRLLFDEHSFRFHCKRLWEIARGELPPAIYLQAIEVTLRDVEPKDVGNLGAYFKRTLDNLRVRRTDAEYDEEYADQRGIAV